MADALLAEAERAGARVTVLAVGTWLGQYPQIAERILRGGHDLGNHTMHHLDITAMDASGAYAEIAGCAQRLRALTGSIGRWFRPSQTRYSTPLIEREARKAGYQTCVSYDVDSLDYTDPGPDAIVSTVLGSARPGSIVSMHLGHPGTVTALPAILRGLASRGLRPVTLTDLLSRDGYGIGRTRRPGALAGRAADRRPGRARRAAAVGAARASGPPGRRRPISVRWWTRRCRPGSRICR